MLLAVGFLNNISGSFKKYCKLSPDEASLVQLGGGVERLNVDRV